MRFCSTLLLSPCQSHSPYAPPIEDSRATPDWPKGDVRAFDFPLGIPSKLSGRSRSKAYWPQSDSSIDESVEFPEIRSERNQLADEGDTRWGFIPPLTLSALEPRTFVFGGAVRL